ncbi:g929 [Coccomyxa elongata]
MNKWRRYEALVTKYSVPQTTAARRFNLVRPEAGLLKEQTPEARALDELGLKSLCCRRMMLTHQDILDDVL